MEERLCNIDIPSEREPVPFVTPPAFLAENSEGGVGGIKRDNVLATVPAPSAVKLALIAPCQSPLLSALRTQRRRGDQFLLAVEDRRDFLIKREIILRNLEAGAALFAGLLHRKNTTIEDAAAEGCFWVSGYSSTPPWVRLIDLLQIARFT